MISEQDFDSEHSSNSEDDRHYKPYISKSLMQKEEQYRKWNEELSARTTNLIEETNHLTTDGLQLIDLAFEQPSAAEHVVDEIEFQDAEMQPSKTPLNPSSRRPIPRSAPPLSAAKGNTRTSAATAIEIKINPMELELIEKIAHQLQQENPPTDHDYALEATNRFLKARLVVMEKEFERVLKDLDEKDKSQTTTESTLQALNDSFKSLQKQHQQVQTANKKLMNQVQSAETKSNALQATLTQTQKELNTVQKSGKSTSSDLHAREIKLNRALEETDRIKKKMVDLEATHKLQQDQLKQANTSLSVELKRVEKQKQHLMVGFKKQGQLIDILRKQKLHIEAAQLLGFTEQEFTKLLDWHHA